MILQPQHKHEQTPPAQVINPIAVPASPSPEKKQEKIKAPAILTQLLQNSTQLLNKKSLQHIKQAVKNSQQKVMTAFADGPNGYLGHLISQMGSYGSQDLLKEVIGLQNDIFISKIQFGRQNVNEKNQLKDLKSQLTDKISEMKKNMMSLSVIDKKASKEFDNLMEFRKKSYWMIPSQKNQNLKAFITKMKRIHSQHRNHYRKVYKEQEKKIQTAFEQQKMKQQKQKKDQYSKQLQKQAIWRKQRQKFTQQQRKKRQQIQTLLKKWSPQKRIYQKNQQTFFKQYIEPLQQQRQRKLQEIKEKHLPMDHDQLQQHIQKYQQHRQSMMQQHSKKKQQEKEIQSKLQQQLKELFHGRYHQNIQPRFYNSVKIEKESIRKRLRDYGSQVKEKHKPAIDQQKKAQLKQSILNLQLTLNKNKRKTVMEDGSIVIQDKPDIDPRKLGVIYLEKLKEENEGKPRKKQDRSASMMELQSKAKIKRIDYLRQNKPNVKLKQSMGDWKKVVDDSSYSPRQKFQSLMEKVNVMEQKAKQKQSEMRSYKKGQKALQLKEQMDKFYLESVAAKMVILKDVILKE